MQVQESSLHRVGSTSTRGGGGSTQTQQWNDGHIEGHLNLTALRHGWTRNFSLSPSQLPTLDYATLESTLELPTLKLRPTSLRIFVEHPPSSGTFAKIRFWKNDGSLQSVLVQAFFKNRHESGRVTVLEVRDGNSREDAMGGSVAGSSVYGGGSSVFLPGSLSRPGMTKEWLLRKKGSLRGRMGGATSARGGDFDEDDDGELVDTPLQSSQNQRPPPTASRTQALMFLLGLSSAPRALAPPPLPPKTDDDHAQDRIEEEAALRKRGWLPPVFRRITSRRARHHSSNGHEDDGDGDDDGNNRNRGNKRSKLLLHRSSNPFFSPSERNLVRSRTRGSATTAASASGTGTGADDSEGRSVRGGGGGGEDSEGGEELGLISETKGSSTSISGRGGGEETSGGGGGGGGSKMSRWLRFRTPAAVDEEVEEAETELTTTTAANNNNNRRSSTPKGKQQHASSQKLKGAQVVKKPMDAFEHGPGNLNANSDVE